MRSVIALLSLCTLWLSSCVQAAEWRDDFTGDLSQWRIELEQGGDVTVHNGVLDIDVPRGATLWFKQELHAPVRIEYDALLVSEGGANDRVSDLNAFWMATQADGSSPLGRRHGSFAEYNDLRTYYVGIGGNYNTTTRLRRYIGDNELRPLLPEHDLSNSDVLLTPNRWQHITLITSDKGVEVWRDQQRLFVMADAAPYLHGWFALRTVQNHLRIRHLHIISDEAKLESTDE